MINYKEPRHFPRISFAEVLSAAQRQDREFLSDTFNDRIVLIGIVGQPGDEDLHSTPFYSWRDDPTMPRRTPGVEIHASVITTLMEGNALQELARRSQLLITVMATALVVSLQCCLFSTDLFADQHGSAGSLFAGSRCSGLSKLDGGSSWWPPPREVFWPSGSLR